MNPERRPELFQFFAGYFHEDWAVDAETPDDVVAAFIVEHQDGKELTHLAELIDAFIAEVPDDQALEQALFEELGCYYLPMADGRSARSWLQHVSGRLRAAT